MQTSSSSSVAAPTTLRISDSMFNAPDSRASTHEVTAQRWSKRVTPLGALPPSTLLGIVHCLPLGCRQRSAVYGLLWGRAVARRGEVPQYATQR